MKIKINSKRSFITLIEMLIVMSILAVTASVVTVNIRGLLREQRFYSGVEQVLDKFQVAQNIMLILNSDVKVEIYRDEEGQYLCDVIPEKALTASFRKILQENRKIVGIDHITFNETENLSFRFSALSQTLPIGNLRLSSDDNEFSQYIPFYGYPHPLKIKNHREVIDEIQTESAALYPKDVRERWQQRLINENRKETLPTS
jgi:type II secretory pathway pseudopilin PulG